MTQAANLIFFQSDNHNRAVTGCYGHAYVRTPNIDRIAASGLRFANSYSASALCCPARAAIATGRYPHQTGFWDNAIAYDGSVPSWHHRLREQGHTVVAIGKLHYRSAEDDNGFTEAIITHMDEQIGAVMNAAEALGLLHNTRIAYTSDHGELFGTHGLFGQKNLYEGAVGVPLLLSGPDVPFGKVSRQIVSHVDLFPTLVEGAGARLAAVDSELEGVSLWPTVTDEDRVRLGFAEYHAQASKAAAYVLRDGPMKLIYHVGMPPQLFDLAHDPDELIDLADAAPEVAKMLEGKLRAICNPEAVDVCAKADQRKWIDYWGGKDKVESSSQILFTPPPGVSKDDAWAIPKP